MQDWVKGRLASAGIAAVAGAGVGWWVAFRQMPQAAAGQRIAVAACCTIVAFVLGLLFRVRL